MSTSDPQPESFAEFKQSFSYGSRTDLNFKFLKSLSDEAAAQFLQALLWKLGDSFDDGNIDRLVAHVRAGQEQAYADPGEWRYDQGPFTPLQKPLSASRLALLTSTGHFVAGDDPAPLGAKNMTQAEAIERIDDFLKTEPQLSTIPSDTPRETLRARHGGYDIRGVQADRNVAFPLDRLRELQQEGLIGQLAPLAYSFVGACSQLRLTKRTGPAWVERLQKQALDVVLLVPV